jgi:hypothetical protein
LELVDNLGEQNYIVMGNSIIEIPQKTRGRTALSGNCRKSEEENKVLISWRQQRRHLVQPVLGGFLHPFPQF